MQVGEQVHEVGCNGVSTETPVEGVQPLTVDDPHVDVVALRVIRSASDDRMKLVITHCGKQRAE